jgi:uncharacterized membrane protein YkgB
MSLSPQEQRILAAIEDQLTRDDPALAGLLSRRSAAGVGRTYVRSALLGLLVGVLVVLVLLAVGAPVVALVAGAVEIALPVVAVALLVASHVLRWYARRALFGRSRHP